MISKLVFLTSNWISRHLYAFLSLQGIKPASLGKVGDPQVKQFIEKCLVPVSMRLPATELLKDPFLATENSKDLVSVSLRIPELKSKEVNSLQSESHSMDIDTNIKKPSIGSCTKSIGEVLPISTLEAHRFTGNNEFRLRGEKNYDSTISLSLRIVEQCGEFIYFTNRIFPPLTAS